MTQVDGEGIESAVEQTLSRLRRIDAVPDPITIVPEPAPGAPPRTLADLYNDHRLRLVRLAVLLVDEPTTAEPSHMWDWNSGSSPRATRSALIASSGRTKPSSLSLGQWSVCSAICTG